MAQVRPHLRRRSGVPKGVPAYCYPAPRRSRTRWLAVLAVTAGWAALLAHLQEHPDPTPAPSAVITIDITLESADALPAALEAAGLGAPATPAAAVRAPAVAGSWSAGLTPLDGTPTVPAPAERQPAAAATPAPAAADAPSSGPRTSSDAPALVEALAAAADGAARQRWLPAQPFTPASHDCLRLCGRGPPASRPLV